MKTTFKVSTYLTTLILAIFICNELNAQNRFTFTYDANGNRESRVLIVDGMGKGEISFPLDEKSINAQEEEVQELATPEAESIKIYPNPTSGILKIVFENLSLASEGECQIFSLGGTQLKEIKAIMPETEFNLTDLSNGVYILMIRINGSIYNYRIVKR